MKKTIQLLGCLCAAFLLFTFTGCSSDSNSSASKPDLVFYGLTSGNALVKYNAKHAETPISSIAITGLQAGEAILGIDFRPSTGQLYGLGSTSRLYIINTITGTATAVSATPFAFTLTTSSEVGFDFNPTVDRIRIVTSNGANFRLNPDTALLVGPDANLNPGTPSVASAAYNNNYSTATVADLFVIDNATATLYKQNPPNGGTLVAVGSLDITGTLSGNGGFDIDAVNGTAIASITVDGEDHLYQIDLTTGKASDLGELNTSIVGLAIPTQPIAFAVDASNNLLTFNLTNPGTPNVKAISGLQAAETIVGIDMRPATGQLYGLGSTGRLYLIGIGSGSVTQVGAGPAQALSGTDFGFDFNPTVDRVRVVSNTGQNFRINPDTGVLAANDAALNPGTPNVTAAAYINNYVGATLTSLYVIDSTTDTLYIQNPPNNGTLTSVGSLGVDVTASNGFDFGGTSNIGYALLTVGGTNGIYTIDKDTGAATLIAAFPAGSIKGFAVGLGF